MDRVVEVRRWQISVVLFTATIDRGEKEVVLRVFIIITIFPRFPTFHGKPIGFRFCRKTQFKPGPTGFVLNVSFSFSHDPSIRKNTRAVFT